MKQSYLFLADGFEEIEALGTVDILRRAGMSLTTVSISEKKEVTGAHGITVIADVLISEKDAITENPEWLIMPGGMPGATNLSESPQLRELINSQAARKGNIAAICASPAIVLAPLGLLNGIDATCYPGMEHLCTNAIMHRAPVVIAGNIITGAGPAATMRFALAIVAASCGDDKAREVGKGMLIPVKVPEFDI